MLPSVLRSAHPLNEYIIVVQPHADLCNTINALKQQFAATYQLPAVKFSKPNITLVHFKQYETMERKIVHRLQNIAAIQAPFVIQLSNFGSFPTHTIYIGVATPQPIVQLGNAIKSIQLLLKPNSAHKPHFITEPHMMVARKLQPWQYEQGWMQYSQMTFKAQFVANEMVLLKRAADSKVFVLAAKFGLLNQNTVMHQASLF